MPQAVRGVLIESDESVMSFIRTMDEKSKYIIEELDSRHVLVQENKVEEIRAKLEAVSASPPDFNLIMFRRRFCFVAECPGDVPR